MSCPRSRDCPRDIGSFQLGFVSFTGRILITHYWMKIPWYQNILHRLTSYCTENRHSAIYRQVFQTGVLVHITIWNVLLLILYKTFLRWFQGDLQAADIWNFDGWDQTRSEYSGFASWEIKHAGAQLWLIVLAVQSQNRPLTRSSECTGPKQIHDVLDWCATTFTAINELEQPHSLGPLTRRLIYNLWICWHWY